MRVLILAPLWPEPASSAGGRRILDLIQLFKRQGWELHFGSPAALNAHSADLIELGLKTHFIRLNCDSFDEILKQIDPQVVIFDRFYTEEQFGWRVERSCPEALRIIETCDLHSLRETRHTLIKRDREYRYYKESELREAMLTDEKTLREIAAIYRSDLSLMISSYETRFLEEQFQVPSTSLHTCGFMIDHLPDSLVGFNQRNDFVTIGNFLHEPNWDSVLWLQQKIWPLIRAKLPTAQMKIYGAYTPAKAQQLHNPQKGFLLLGRAADSLQALSESHVLLSPLRFGAGLKGKLFESFITGTPSVTTSIGSEGMKPKDIDWCGRIEDHPEEIACAAVELYTNQELWEKHQKQAPKLLRPFLTSAQGPALIQRITDLSNEKSKFRSLNFVGRLLRHHSMQSARHLSNWIALKNKVDSTNSPETGQHI